MEDAALIDGILERLKNSSDKAVEEEEKDENKEKVGPESEGA